MCENPGGPKPVRWEFSRSSPKAISPFLYEEYLTRLFPATIRNRPLHADPRRLVRYQDFLDAIKRKPQLPYFLGFRRVLGHEFSLRQKKGDRSDKHKRFAFRFRE